MEDIKEGKEYDGFRVFVIGHFFNLKVPFHIDVSTGDQITPKAICYHYKRMFEEEWIELMAYNYETVIAEKLQSILDLKLQNSRMKDYYDIYYLVVFNGEEINNSVLKKAIVNTFNNRNTLHDLDDINHLLEVFKKDKTLNKLWKNYQDTHNYAKKVSFHETIDAIETIINNIY